MSDAGAAGTRRDTSGEAIAAWAAARGVRGGGARGGAGRHGRHRAPPRRVGGRRRGGPHPHHRRDRPRGPRRDAGGDARRAGRARRRASPSICGRGARPPFPRAVLSRGVAGVRGARAHREPPRLRRAGCGTASPPWTSWWTTRWTCCRAGPGTPDGAQGPHHARRPRGGGPRQRRVRGGRVRDGDGLGPRRRARRGAARGPRPPAAHGRAARAGGAAARRRGARRARGHLGLLEPTDADPAAAGAPPRASRAALVKPCDADEVVALGRRLIERKRLQERTGILGEHPGDPGGAHQDRAARAGLEHGADRGRVGDGQGAGGAGDPRPLAAARASRSSPSTARRSPRRCSSRSCSATRRGPSPARRSGGWAASSWRTAGPSSSTRSGRCRPRRR